MATAEHVTRTPRSTPGLLRLEWDFGLQSRAFVDDGYFDQDRFEGSFSLQFDYYKSWDNDRQSFTATPFVRLDSADSHRTHGDRQFDQALRLAIERPFGAGLGNPLPRIGQFWIPLYKVMV